MGVRFGLEAWGVEPSSYPVGAPTRDQLRAAVAWAVLAPSSHNSQPWLFDVRPDHVDVLADRSRALPVVDPDDRELTISVGAAVYMLGIALQRFGHDALGRIAKPLIGRLDIGGGERRTVVEFHVRLQLERISHQIGSDLPGLSEIALDLRKYV